jgi:hypothetical protein
MIAIVSTQNSIATLCPGRDPRCIIGVPSLLPQLSYLLARGIMEARRCCWL